jgi:hypothetical protein
MGGVNAANHCQARVNGVHWHGAVGVMAIQGIGQHPGRVPGLQTSVWDGAHARLKPGFQEHEPTTGANPDSPSPIAIIRRPALDASRTEGF